MNEKLFQPRFRTSAKEGQTFRLYCGDARDILPTLPWQFDLVMTDPPYAHPTRVAQGRGNTRNKGDLSIIETAMEFYFQEIEKHLNPWARIFCFCDSHSYPVIYRALYGRWNITTLVWDKGRIGMGRDFRKRHELICYAWRDGAPRAEDKSVPDILRFQPVPSVQRIHPAQKPVDLMLRLILQVMGTGGNGTVLDPFMGSGTSGLAAFHAGMSFCGIDVSHEWFRKAVGMLGKWTRIETHPRDQAVLDGVKYP